MAQKTIVIESIVEKSLVVLVLVKVAAKRILEEHNEKDFIHLRAKCPLPLRALGSSPLIRKGMLLMKYTYIQIYVKINVK